MNSTRRAHLIGLGANTVLAAAKLTVGLLAGSEALTADGFNSTGDIFATAVGFAGFLYATKPADDDHHYGHGNAESLAGLIIGSVLMATGGFIILHSTLALAQGVPPPPDAAALWVALLTIPVKEGLFRYATRVGSTANSPSLLATARDHRADVFLSLTVFGGILAARLGAPLLDPLIGAAVGVYVLVMALDPIRTNLATLMDRSSPALRDRIREIAEEEPAVRGVDEVRVHPLGSYHLIDLEIELDATLDLRSADAIARRVADRIRARVAHTRDVKVHVRPGR
jgi:cation diffusion facilitator family transporter